VFAGVLVVVSKKKKKKEGEEGEAERWVRYLRPVKLNYTRDAWDDRWPFCCPGRKEKKKRGKKVPAPRLCRNLRSILRFYALDETCCFVSGRDLFTLKLKGRKKKKGKKGGRSARTLLVGNV